MVTNRDTFMKSPQEIQPPFTEKEFLLSRVFYRFCEEK
ncbi:conserved hypothetical protein [delta proteobacterium NaphS2]|nr:conserved hypothetical protein [delta proteobacterium NaphS2]